MSYNECCVRFLPQFMMYELETLQGMLMFETLEVVSTYIEDVRSVFGVVVCLGGVECPYFYNLMFNTP